MKNRKNWIHHDKKSFVNAPVINELPVTLEYELVKVIDESKYLGRIVNVSVDQGVLGEDGKSVWRNTARSPMIRYITGTISWEKMSATHLRMVHS